MNVEDNFSQNNPNSKRLNSLKLDPRIQPLIIMFMMQFFPHLLQMLHEVQRHQYHLRLNHIDQVIELLHMRVYRNRINSLFSSRQYRRLYPSKS